MAKAYSYIRMSTPEQLKGDSTRRQWSSTLAYIKANGLELAEAFHDRGVSAFRGRNAQFGELGRFLEAVQNGEIEEGSYLIVESLDRITRENVFFAMNLLSEIVSGGVNVVTLIDGQCYSKAMIEENSMILMIAAMTLMRAHEESKTKSVRMASAWSNKREIARTGRVTRQRLPAWLQFSTSGEEIEPISERVKILEEIFDLSCNGWGAYSIAKRLNEQNEIPWGRANFWQESYIKKILANRSVLGEYQPHSTIKTEGRSRVSDGRPILDYYPAVIDPVVFADAQEAAARRTTARGRKGHGLPNLFSGLLRCGACKSGLRYVDKGPPPKGGQYLVCSKSILTRECSAPYFRYQVIEDNLLQLFNGMNVEAILKGPDWMALTNGLKAKILEHRSAESALQSQLNNIVKAISEGGASLTLVKAIGDLEQRQFVEQQDRKLVEGELAQLASESGLAQSDLIDGLKSESLSSDDRLILRRKVADEIRRLVTHITLIHTQHMSTLPDEDGSGGYEPSDEIVDTLRDPNKAFEVFIFYRDKSYVHFDSVLDEKSHVQMGNKLNIFEHNSFIENL
ncbi:MAG TPA: recombinase family protein [Sphingobium sp.]